MKLKLTLNGSGGIRFTPVAERNRVQLKSPCPIQVFKGRFSPPSAR
jgi:inner membrane protein involved in colicin E2 resistance